MASQLVTKSKPLEVVKPPVPRVPQSLMDMIRTVSPTTNMKSHREPIGNVYVIFKLEAYYVAKAKVSIAEFSADIFDERGTLLTTYMSVAPADELYGRTYWGQEIASSYTNNDVHERIIQISKEFPEALWVSYDPSTETSAFLNIFKTERGIEPPTIIGVQTLIDAAVTSSDPQIKMKSFRSILESVKVTNANHCSVMHYGNCSQVITRAMTLILSHLFSSVYPEFKTDYKESLNFFKMYASVDFVAPHDNITGPLHTSDSINGIYHETPVHYVTKDGLIVALTKKNYLKMFGDQSHRIHEGTICVNGHYYRENELMAQFFGQIQPGRSIPYIILIRNWKDVVLLPWGKQGRFHARLGVYVDEEGSMFKQVEITTKTAGIWDWIFCNPFKEQFFASTSF